MKNDATRKDDVGEISTKNLTELIDVTPRWLQQLSERAHVPKRIRHGFYPHPETVRAYVQYLREGGGETTIADARLRKELANAEIAEHEAAKIQERLVDAEVVKKQWASIATEVRIRLLLIPSKLAPLLVGKNKATEIENILTVNMNEALVSIQNADKEEKPE